MSNSTTFRLTTDKKEGTWAIRGGSAKKNGVAKFINYWPGSNSIFDEDNKESIVKPKTVVFRYNDILSDPGVEIVVPNENKVLIDYLKAHPFFNIHYKIHNQNEIDEQKSQEYDKIEEALSLIKETDDTKAQAIALAVFGIDAYGWQPSKCKASLKEKAVNSPAYVLEQMNSGDYESKYLAALAVYSGVIAEDYSRSAVVWNDNQRGTILTIAKGESGILKLAELLSIETDESRVILQEIGSRIQAKNATAPALNSNQISGSTNIKSEAQIREELKAELKAEALIEARAQLEKENANKNLTEAAAVKTEVDPKKDFEEYDPTDLTQAQAKYKELFGKDVSNPKKNDLEWINKTIDSKNI